jgi:hypothetical protein
MKMVAQLLLDFAPLGLAGGLPFVRVIRGESGWKWFAVCWVSFVVWMFVFSFVIPMAINSYDRELGREAFNWVPEGPVVIAMLFIGWLYAAPVVWLGLLVRKVREVWQDRRATGL